VGPSGQTGKRKRKKARTGSGPKGAGPALLAQQAQLGSWGQLGLRLNRPARAGGLAGSSWALLLFGPWWAGGLLPSPPPPRWLGCLCSFPFSLTARSHSSASTGSGVAGPGSDAAGGRACVRVGAMGVCVCERPEGVRGSASKAWPRRERDVAATSRGCRARRGRGRAWRGWGVAHGLAWVWPGLAARVRTHARGSWRSRAAAWPCRARGTGIPGPWHDAAAVRRRWQWGRRRRVRLLHKSGTKAKRGEVVLGLEYGGFFGNAGSKG
jgi:hypothetical protein